MLSVLECRVEFLLLVGCVECVGPGDCVVCTTVYRAC